EEMITLLLLAIIFLGNLLVAATFLWLGARCVKAPKASYLRAFSVAFLLGTLPIAFYPVIMRLQDASARDGPTDVFVMQCVVVGAYICLSWLIIKLSFQTNLLRAIAVWAIGLLSGLVGLAAVFGVIKPYLEEAFIVPTNAMAPAVLGWHE